MKILFGICTEGNGHCTQAVALKQYLTDKNHIVVGALAANKKKGLAKYFTDEFDLTTYEGFDFVFDKTGRVVIWKTGLKNIYKLPKLIYSFCKIINHIKKLNPDIIINCYEPIIGLTAIFFPNIKYVSVGHQYAMFTDTYPKIKGFYIQKIFLKIINYITSINAKTVALSFYEFKDNNVIVCPPILRKESYTKSDNNSNDNIILVYLMNEDMLPQLISQAEKYPDVKIECFTKLTNNQNKSNTVPRNLQVNNLDGKLFQEKMKTCKAVICSGGFETTSEAILQHKPVLMIPIENHYEQYANANDATVHKFAAWSKTIDLLQIPKNQIGNDSWFIKFNEIFNNIIK